MKTPRLRSDLVPPPWPLTRLRSEMEQPPLILTRLDSRQLFSDGFQLDGDRGFRLCEILRLDCDRGFL